MWPDVDVKGYLRNNWNSRRTMLLFFLLEQKAFVSWQEQGTVPCRINGVPCDGCGHGSCAVSCWNAPPHCLRLSRLNLSSSHQCNLMKKVRKQAWFSLLCCTPLCDLREVSMGHSTKALRPRVCRWMCILQTPSDLSVGIGHLKCIWPCISFPNCFLLVSLHVRFAFCLMNSTQYRVRSLQSHWGL